jgi:hypothetical protein
LGYVNAEKLSELMSSAKCLVFPSLYEGFGMPVVEALQVGTPVACSNSTSLPEVGGGAAEYFDPMDPVEMADAIERAFNNGNLPEWREKARHQAGKFSFEMTANLLIDAMDEFSSRGPDLGVSRRSSPSNRLGDFWRDFPSVDLIILPDWKMGKCDVKADEFKALNSLSIARLNPICLRAIHCRDGTVVSVPESDGLPLAPYRKALASVAEGKLVIYLPKREVDPGRSKISRLFAIQVVFWQLKILRRTCREALMAILTGLW